jgi:hypothetical protein
MTPDYYKVSPAESPKLRRKTYPVDCGPCLGIHTIAAIRLPGSDIRETLVSAGVDPRVQEAEYGLASAKTSVIEKCNDSGGKLSDISESFTIVQLMIRRTGEAAEVPPLGVRTPP